MRPVALLQPLRDVALGPRHQRELELRQALGQVLARPEVGPDDLARFACRISLDRDLVVVRGAGRHVRKLDAPAVHVVLPAVIDAAQPALFVAAEEQVRAAVRALGLDQAHAALRIAERDQLLAEQLHADRRAIGLGKLARQRDRLPEAPEILAHQRAGAGAAQQLVVGCAQHRGLIAYISRRCEPCSSFSWSRARPFSRKATIRTAPSDSSSPCRRAARPISSHAWSVQSSPKRWPSPCWWSTAAGPAARSPPTRWPRPPPMATRCCRTPSPRTESDRISIPGCRTTRSRTSRRSRDSRCCPSSWRSTQIFHPGTSKN